MDDACWLIDDAGLRITQGCARTQGCALRDACACKHTCCLHLLLSSCSHSPVCNQELQSEKQVCAFLLLSSSSYTSHHLLRLLVPPLIIKLRIAKFVKGLEQTNPVKGEEQRPTEKFKDIYENYIHPYHPQQTSYSQYSSHKESQQPQNSHHDVSADPFQSPNTTNGKRLNISIFGKRGNLHNKPHTNKTENVINEQDYMTMNEPQGPELKYHQLKKMKNKTQNSSATYGKAQQEHINQPLPPNTHQNKHQQMNYNQHNQPQINEYDPHYSPFKHGARMGHEKMDVNEADKDPNIPPPEGPDEELNEFFKHNSERMDKFIKDREKYGNYYGDAKIEDEETAKEEQAKEKEKEGQKEKMKKERKEKQQPTPEDVDRNARKYIKQFIFKIHPDFFHQDSAKKAASILRFTLICFSLVLFFNFFLFYFFFSFFFCFFFVFFLFFFSELSFTFIYMHALQVLNSFLESVRALRDPSSYLLTS